MHFGGTVTSRTLLFVRMSFMVLAGLLCSRPLLAQSSWWDRLFGRSSTQYVPVGTQYVPVTTYQPVTTFVPVTSFMPMTTFPAAPSAVPSQAMVLSQPPVVPAVVSTIATPSVAAPQGQVVYSAGGAVNLASTGPVVSPAPPTVPVVVPPSTTYRTIWYRIPVTSFRSTTTVDPATGQTTTVMVPCVTYTWQARRVPTGTSDGFFARLFGHRRNATVQAPAALTVCPPIATPTAPSTTTISPPTAPGALIPPTAPSTAIPSGQGYGGTAPGTLQPSMPSGAPGSPGGSPMREPADMPPSLDPSQYQHPPSPQGSASRHSGRSYGSSGGALASETMSAWNGERETPERASRSPSVRSSGSASSSGTRPDTEVAMPPGPDPDTQFQLRPIPDPRAVRELQKVPPRLMNPRDRTAELAPQPSVRQDARPAGAKPVEYAAWTRLNSQTTAVTKTSANDGAVSGRDPSEGQKALLVLDDKGWRSKSR